MDYRIAGAWLALSLTWTLPAAVAEEPTTQKEGPIIFGTEVVTFQGPRRSYFEFLSPNTVVFTHRDQLHPGENPSLECSYTVPACGAGDVVDACDVERVLSGARLLDRLPAEGDEVHGGDPRHADGPINFFTTTDRGRLLMGNPCRASSSACSEEDQILQRLVDAFAELRRKAEADGECLPSTK